MSAPRKPKRKVQEAAINISEFKQWLAGVEDMQEDGWVPDAVQWAKIRAKVELLAETDGQIEQIGQSTGYIAPPGFIPGAPLPYTPHAGQDYASLGDVQWAPNPRAHRPSMLSDDGIVMPTKTAQDAAFDQGLSSHVPDQFS